MRVGYLRVVVCVLFKSLYMKGHRLSAHLSLIFVPDALRLGWIFFMIIKSCYPRSGQRTLIHLEKHLVIFSASFTSCTIGRGSAAFLPEPVKGWLPMPLAQNLRAASGLFLITIMPEASNKNWLI